MTTKQIWKQPDVRAADRRANDATRAMDNAFMLADAAAVAHGFNSPQARDARAAGDIAKVARDAADREFWALVNGYARAK